MPTALITCDRGRVLSGVLVVTVSVVEHDVVKLQNLLVAHVRLRCLVEVSVEGRPQAFFL